MEQKKQERNTNKLDKKPSQFNNGPLAPSDLQVDDLNRIYHLQLYPEQLAPDILLVGDPGRAELIGETLLTDLEYQHGHRGLVTVTGKSQVSGEKTTIISANRTTVATTGMGTASLEIVLGELVGLNEMDFKTRMMKPDFPRLHIIRLGTSGGLQDSTILGTPNITTYAIGMDNTGCYYEAPYQDKTCQRLEGELVDLFRRVMQKGSRFHGSIHPYVSRADPHVVAALEQAAGDLGVSVKKGLTVSAPGFYIPQGRDVFRIHANLPEIDTLFTDFDPGLDGQRVENMEMESSFLLHFMGGLGYWAGSICAVIANRRKNTFTANYQESMLNAGRVALHALALLRRSHPDDSMKDGK